MTDPWGIVLPSSFLDSTAFALLSAFVALNTVMYVVLAVAKILPKLYLSDLLRRPRRRGETRSIHPDGPVDPPGRRPADPR
jgi:hypothetical protein